MMVEEMDEAKVAAAVILKDPVVSYEAMLLAEVQEETTFLAEVQATAPI